ncbi:hypothetical protein FNU79_02495 [Deinococcus detaillensis]|uniref:Uncharacterized protein n=1 Tax=Deinococcus detaillensis TaxID=2592048 RepID=A0A553V6L6_9DEIO|nr:hypothetical protein [Deinococcus detaillensis]TSA88113.1 hypothetical protein FNU79_02495 [Deinococcus detaillensis]
MTNLTLKQPALALALLGTSLVLGACGSTTPVTPPATQPTAVSGTLVPFTAGTADNVTSQQANLSSPLTATGNFDIALPDVATMNSTHAKDLNSADNTFGLCTGSPITAPSGFKSVAITTLISQKGATFVAENVAGSTVSYKGWWFANMAGTVTVNANCIGFGNVNQSLTFKQGWNVMDFTYNGTSTSIALAPNQTPGRLTWKNKNAVQSLSSQALNPYLFNPWAALNR